MEWGLQHEVGGVLTFLRQCPEIPEAATHLPITVKECGFLTVPDAPFKMGASPDALLEFGDGFRAVLEVKSVSPFTAERATGGGPFTYVGGRKRLPSSVHPVHFCQVQLQMMAAGVGTAFLVSYGVKTTKVFQVLVSPAWCATMQAVLLQLHALYGAPGASSPGTPAQFGRIWGPSYAQFLQLTLAEVNRCSREVAEVESFMPNGWQQQPRFCS
jgi:hypothetical protein